LFKRESFTNLYTWLKEVEKHAKNDVQMIVIGNKSDRAEKEQAEVSETDM
jgi:GTPase SAR1 family protein